MEPVTGQCGSGLLSAGNRAEDFVSSSQFSEGLGDHVNREEGRGEH